MGNDGRLCNLWNGGQMKEIIAELEKILELMGSDVFYVDDEDYDHDAMMNALITAISVLRIRGVVE
tara:strand:- start:415 stop:612 length:198 start_codon:yes stop_codon:yes gene_type:complete